MKLKPMEFTVEDERTFLVKSMPQNIIFNNDGRDIVQWYICFDPPIRVRMETVNNESDCCLTIKSNFPNSSEKRHHLEGGISLPAACVLTEFIKSNIIRKTRYKIGNTEIDVFHEGLAGLVLIEFEKGIEGGTPKIPADFSVKEVTGNTAFRNHNLAKLDSIPKEWRCEFVS